LAGDVFATPSRHGEPVALADVALKSPTAPRTVLVTMGGFLPADGTPLAPDAVPWLVPKVTPRVSGDGGQVVVPSFVSTLWIEVELAIVIGKLARNVTPDEARAAIFGYTCFNDVSAPQFILADVAQRTPSVELDIWRAKSIETFASMGPWIRTDLSEERIQEGLALRTKVNGVTRAQGNTRDHKFLPATWVAFASRYTTLYPGDVISLGTPEPCEASPGDVVELEIEGIGALHNYVVAESTTPHPVKPRG
jgi:2-keto-4-pentenoate hydratase/2-oxohepta-3-ene-1,7-dioic acid hydratase in catechol pathway